MKICKIVFAALFVSFAGNTLHAQETTPPAKAGAAPAGKPTEAEMMAKMMELAEPNEHHRQLAELVGHWDYTVKMSMEPGAEMAEAGKGTAVRTAVMGGRYFIMNVAGKILMPGPDGKVTNADFKGMSVDGYDNVQQKFVSSWIDSMGTSIVLSLGTYDAPTKTFTYLFEMEPMPGMKTKARQVVKILDPDHEQMDWYETSKGRENKTMEIDYVRQK